MKNGFLPIIKVQGITTYDIIRKLKKYIKKTKIGHTGTLDPNASGLVIIAIGKATKFMHYLKKQKKVYDAEIVFGHKSTTGDPDGEITEVEITKELTMALINEACNSFLGEVWQKPHIFSAIKKDGKPLYKYARKNKEVEIESKIVTFFSIESSNFADNILKCTIECSPGTYIRSFAEDLAEKLGTGAYLKSLYRKSTDGISDERALCFDKISSDSITGHFISISCFLPYYPLVRIDDGKGFDNGLRCSGTISEIPTGKTEFARVFEKNEFLGLGIIKKQKGSDVIVQPKIVVREKE